MAPALLHVRSRATLVAASIVSVGVLAAPVVTWLLLPADLQQAVGPDLFAAGLVLLVLVAFVMIIGLSSVRADDTGLTIRNGPVRHRYAWHEIVDVRFREGDSWAYVYTFRRDSDGDAQRHLVLAIQAPDGDRARLHAARLREIWLGHRP